MNNWLLMGKGSIDSQSNCSIDEGKGSRSGPSAKMYITINVSASAVETFERINQQSIVLFNTSFLGFCHLIRTSRLSVAACLYRSPLEMFVASHLPY